MHDSPDASSRTRADNAPQPEFPDAKFHRPPALKDCRVAIVTSAALQCEGSPGWQGLTADIHFETIPHAERDLRIGHVSPNFDRSGFAQDINVVYPVDRLDELASRGAIGSVASYHYSFAGNAGNQLISGLRLDSGPACAKKLLDDDVDVVLLTPV